jgi:hypothetical protein
VPRLAMRQMIQSLILAFGPNARRPKELGPLSNWPFLAWISDTGHHLPETSIRSPRSHRGAWFESQEGRRDVAPTSRS